MNTLHIDDFKGKRLHLIGIGGTSMNGLAMILNQKGYVVTGSDRGESPFTRRLAELGIPVTIGQTEANVHGADMVIYSAAIKPENPERTEARRLGIPEMERSELLGQLSSQYGTVVGVAGCHGKTTITSMLALITMEAKLDPTVHVGGFVDFLQGGIALGNSSLFLTEACEYVESFLHIHPTHVIINNIDNDHLDYFGDMEHICSAFRKFVALMPPDGVLFGCADDPRVVKLMEERGHGCVSYGLTGGDYTARDIEIHSDGTTRFTVLNRDKPLTEIALAVPGKHNVVNALAALAAALELGAPLPSIASALAKYRLTRRRFEFYGERDGVAIYHDYAHHPAEIAACLQGARSVCKGKLYAVFQCNSYTRAKTLFCGDVRCFADADEVLVPDIYPGREVDTGIVHARDMVAAINAAGSKALYLPTFPEIKEYLRAHWQPGDMVVTLGSGDVYVKMNIFLQD